jgi:hypothetical protein
MEVFAPRFSNRESSYDPSVIRWGYAPMIVAGEDVRIDKSICSLGSQSKEKREEHYNHQRLLVI